MPKKRRRGGPVGPPPPKFNSRQTAVRRCLKMLEACFPRAFVPKGNRHAWTVPLHEDVWTAIYPLVVNDWGFDERTFFGVKSEYTNEYVYWESILKIGIRGGLDGLPGTLDGMYAYLAEHPDALVTPDERRKAKKKIVQWAKHHYPQPVPPAPEPEPVRPTTRKRAATEPAPADRVRPASSRTTPRNEPKQPGATSTAPQPPVSSPDGKPLEQREKRRQGQGPQPPILVKKHRHVAPPEQVPETPAPAAEASPVPNTGRKLLSLKPRKPPDKT